MHPYIHAFSPAIDPPWEARSDFDAFHTIARVFSRLAATHLGVRRDVVMTPLQHDTPGETAYPHGIAAGLAADRRGARCPGKTMGSIAVVTRDYPAMADQWETLGPLVDKLGRDHQGGHRASGPGGRPSWRPGTG